jgi:uncharacterized protein YgbK (DUF1537 family)
MDLGCVADDYTGACDVATALSRGGARTIVVFGPPDRDVDVGSADAVVTGLKIRTSPPVEAIQGALQAQSWLSARGAARTYFKYCSTFDSTDAGNIGPVTEALMRAMGAPATVICPAAPAHGRTLYQGHLFVGSQLLSETAMRSHPLTPMRDSNVVRVLQRQAKGSVGLVPWEVVRAGPRAVARGLDKLSAEGGLAVVDAVDDQDLRTIADASRHLALTTGSAGLAPHVLRSASRPRRPARGDHVRPRGPAAALVGSCSTATLAQVEHARRRYPALRLDPRRTPSADDMVSSCLEWLQGRSADQPVLVYSSAPPDERSPGAADRIERALGRIAVHMVERGTRRLIVGGGETSGAVVDAINVRACTVGVEEARGVPWLSVEGQRPLALLLKSGNFGDPELLARALEPPR